MNGNPQSEQQEQSASGTTPECLCGGMGPAVSQMMRMMAPSGPAAEHFRQARVEALKGLRVMLDQRIDALSRSGANKGTKVTVE